MAERSGPLAFGEGKFVDYPGADHNRDRIHADHLMGISGRLSGRLAGAGKRRETIKTSHRCRNSETHLHHIVHGAAPLRIHRHAAEKGAAWEVLHRNTFTRSSRSLVAVFV